MKMNLIAILLAGLALPAADTRMSLEAQGSVLAATGDLKKMADNHNRGFSLGGAFTVNPAPDIGFRVHVDFNAIMGKDGTGLNNNTLKRFSFGLDAMRVAGRTTFFIGFLGVRWGQDLNTTTLRDYSDWYRATPTSTPSNYNNAGKGTKLGARVGVEFEVANNLAATATFTQTEFNKIFQPSWVSLGLRYRFGLN